MKSRIKIENKYVGAEEPVFVIAEISANHGQSLERALSLTREAKKCGADAVKFQTYTPDTITLDVRNKYFEVEHPEWGNQTLHDLYQKAFTPWDWFKEIKSLCDELDIIFLSSAFDKTSVDFLEDLNVSAHKVASFELVDLPLIEYMAKTKKPLILSTGMASMSEISDAVATAREVGNEDIILLKCVSNYPAKPDQMNLGIISIMKKEFQCPIGFSDHTIEPVTAVAAVCKGAVVLERHFVSSRKLDTPDSFFSTEPKEMKRLIDDIRIVEQTMGTDNSLTPKDEKSKIFRRSLFVVKDIKKGEMFSEENIRSIRPSNGLAPKHWKEIIGQKSTADIKRGSPLEWSHINKEN